MELVRAALTLMKSMKLWQLMLERLQQSDESWFVRGAPTWVGMWLLFLGWSQLSKGSASEVAWGVGFDVVVGVEPVVIDRGGNAGGCVEQVGVRRIGEGWCVVDVEGDHVGGCPSSIGVFGRWGGGVGSVVAVEGVDVLTCGSYSGIGKVMVVGAG